MGFSAASIFGGPIGASLYQGEQSRKAQKRAQAAQEAAQQQAQAAAISQQRRNQEELARKERKTPNIAALLATEQTGGLLSSTMLTGAGGIDPNRLNLSRPTLLGG